MNIRSADLPSAGSSRRWFLATMILLLGISQYSIEAAEIVYRLSDPDRLSGSIQDISRKGIRMRGPKGETIQISPDDVKLIQWEGEPVILRNARNSDVAERNAIAVEGYETALREIPEDQKKFVEDAEFGLARCLARMGSTDAAKADEASRKLTDFTSKYPDSIHYLEAVRWSADLALVRKNEAQAVENYRILKESGTGTYPLLAELGVAQIAMNKQDFPSAQKAFQAVLDTPFKGPLVSRRQQQARLGLTEILINSGKGEDATKLMDEVIRSSSPDDSASLARAYLMRGKIHLNLGNNKEALIDLLHVDLLFSQESAAHAEALSRLATLWPVLQHPERGAEARDRLMALYPDSEWAKQK